MVPDSPRLRRWLSSITTAEWHSFLAAVTIFGLAGAAESPELLASGLALGLWAWGIRASPYRRTASGEKKSVESDDSDADDAPEPGLVTQYLAQIRREPHYYLPGGALVGDALGRLIHLWWFGRFPTHYDELPELIEALVPIVATLI